ncbi:MAG: hypothetical protein AUG14_10945 [Candidatus Rokubacteria bacterium 13_1_20CM_2_68_19]|nr:MAG: hypothetical protein AUG14_10945 [Candidatus Rokubacteria bacterium 13_1_20CM_2_68_19]
MTRLRFDRDYYAMLGVSVKATDDDIRRAYRRLALEFHPDRNPGNAAAEERFKEISEAYAVLIDPAKRRQYDRARQTGVPGDFTVNRDDLFRDLFADPRASAIFEELARELGRMGLHVDHRRFEQTLFGGRTVVSGHVVVISPFTPLTMLFRLARAAVRGARRATDGERAPLPPPRGVLGHLAAAGRWVLGPPRPEALRTSDIVVTVALTVAEAAQGGKKRVALGDGAAAEDVLVTIPAGVREGARLRLRGKGRRVRGGARGDAYLVIRIAG